MARQRPRHHGRHARPVRLFRQGDRWTEAETDYLLQQRSGDRRTPYEDIGIALGRTMLACRLHCHHERQRRRMRASLAAAADTQDANAPSGTAPQAGPSRRARPAARRARSEPGGDRPQLRPIVPQAARPSRIPSIAEQQLPLPELSQYQRTYSFSSASLHESEASSSSAALYGSGRSSSVPQPSSMDYSQTYPQGAYEPPQQPGLTRRDTATDFYYAHQATTTQQQATTWSSMYQPTQPAQNYSPYAYRQIESSIRAGMHPSSVAALGPATRATWGSQHIAMPTHFSDTAFQPGQAAPTEQAPFQQTVIADHAQAEPGMTGYAAWHAILNERVGRGERHFQQRAIAHPPMPAQADSTAAEQYPALAETEPEDKSTSDASKPRRSTIGDILNPPQ